MATQVTYKKVTGHRSLTKVFEASSQYTFCIALNCELNITVNCGNLQKRICRDEASVQPNTGPTSLPGNERPQDLTLNMKTNLIDYHHKEFHLIDD